MAARLDAGRRKLLDPVEDGNRELSRTATDRKSTRLNSSHLGISYAVFCLKKKKERHPVEGIERARVRRHDREDRLDEPGHVGHQQAVLLVGLGVALGPAPELRDSLAVVVH